MISFKQYLEEKRKKPQEGGNNVPEVDMTMTEDGGGAGGGAAGVGSAGPTNVVGGGAIAGTGGKGGEPGVDLRKKKAHNPVMMSMQHRKPPKI